MTYRNLFASLAGLTLACSIALPVSAYEEIEVADGGTIAGKITFSGSVPKRKIITTKDQDVCGGIREEPEIIVGPDKGAKDVVILVTEVAEGKAWSTVAPDVPELDNVECRFEPHVQVIPPGQLNVINSDPVLHNTHGYYGKRTAFNLALPNTGLVIETELGRPGEVRVDCDAHGWMEGWVYVATNPYYAVTAEDGSFAITGVPPGDYTVMVIHELTGPREAKISVPAGGEADLSLDLAAKN